MEARDPGKQGEDSDRRESRRDDTLATRLPAGRHGLPHEFVVQNQRERIITALADLAAEKGYKDTTITDICKTAGVSRRTFYEHFSGKKDCFLAAYEMISTHILESMHATADVFDEWPLKVRAAIATMLRFLSAEPELARVYAFEPIAAGGDIAARHREAMQGLIDILKAGRPSDDTERVLPEVTEETLVGGIVSLIVREIVADRTERLEELLPDLVELALTPYVGAEEAARLARLEPPASPGASPQAASR